MGQRLVPTSIRSSRSSAKGGGSAIARAQKVLPVRERLVADQPWSIVEPAPGVARKRKFVIEIFAGSKHFSYSAAKRGYRCYTVDIEDTPNQNILRPKAYQAIVRLISHPDCGLVWMGTPCVSWSRARRGGGSGPPALRDSHDGLYGLSGLSEKDTQKVLLGNQLMRVSTRLAKLAAAQNIQCVIENPASSRMWLTSEMKGLARFSFHAFQCSFCGYGTPWQKNTCLFAFKAPGLQDVFKCRMKNGRCGFSGKHHEQLVGKNDRGEFRTRIAQPYPALFCSHVAKLLGL